MLGDTIEEIARNKGGIFKEGVRCFSVVQEGHRGEKELREAAERVGVSQSIARCVDFALMRCQAASFDLVPIDPKLNAVKLGMALPPFTISC